MTPEEYADVQSKDYGLEFNNISNQNVFPNPEKTIKSIENYIQELTRLDRANYKIIKDLNEVCKIKHSQWKTKLSEISNQLNRINLSTSQVDSNLGKVHHDALRISNILESTRKRRKNAIQAKVYIHLIFEFNKEGATLDQCMELLNQFKGFDRIRTMKNLKLIATVLESQTEKARKNILAVADMLEDQLIMKFKHLLTSRKIKKVAQIDRYMRTLKQEEKTIAAYLAHLEYQNQFYINESMDMDDIIDNMNTVFYNTLELCKDQYKSTITPVFENPKKVFKLLLEQSFKRILTPYLEHSFANVKRIEKVLRICSHLHEMQSLYNQELNRSPYKIHKPFIAALFDKAAVLDRNQYVNMEILSIHSLFESYNEELKLVKKVPEVNLDIITHVIDHMNKLTKRAQFMLHGIKLYDAVCECMLSFISLLLSKIIQPAIQESSKRITNCLTSFQSFFRASNSVQKINHEVNTFLMVVQSANSSIVPLQQWIYVTQKTFIENSFIGLKCLEVNKKLLSGLETLIDNGIQKVIDIQVLCTRKIFRRQRKKRKTVSSDAESNSKYCNEICSNLKQFLDYVMRSLDGMNLVMIKVNLGEKIVTVLINHLTKFTIVNEEMCMLLLRDLSEYYKVFQQFVDIEKSKQNASLEGLQKQIEIIPVLSKLFIVQAESIADVIDDNPCMELISKETISRIISRRFDFKASWISQHKMTMADTTLEDSSVSE